MRIGVVSDTHGHLGNAIAAVAALEREDVAAVLHCGDVGSTDVVPLFAAWPTHFVLGNVDLHDADELHAAIVAAKQSDHGRFGDLRLDGRRIALLHSDDAHRFREVTQSGEFDLVCYGHTHIAAVHREGPTVVVNPGALFRARHHSIAVIDLPTLEVRHVVVD